MPEASFNVIVKKPSGPTARKPINNRYTQYRVFVNQEMNSENDETKNKTADSDMNRAQFHVSDDYKNEISEEDSDMNRAQFHVSDDYKNEISEDSDPPVPYPPPKIVHPIDRSYNDEPSRQTENYKTRLKELVVKNVYYICLAVVFIAVSVHYINKGPTNQINKLSIIEEFKKMQREFPLLDTNTWPQLAAGIEHVVNHSSKPSVFLFLNLDEHSDQVSNKVANKLAELAARQLDSDDPLILTPEKLNNKKNEGGAIIDNYKSKLERHKVLLLTNLQEVKAEIAKYLHYFCDQENPMVKKSVLIFTLNGLLNSSKGPVALAEATLLATWKPPLADNLILPLITRLTTYVLPITSHIVPKIL